MQVTGTVGWMLRLHSGQSAGCCGCTAGSRLDAAAAQTCQKHFMLLTFCMLFSALFNNYVSYTASMIVE
jgi:hypothetical protein